MGWRRLALSIAIMGWRIWRKEEANEAEEDEAEAKAEEKEV